MVTITDKPDHDPVADMHLLDAYLRWAMEAARKLVGQDGLNAVLREAKLERYIDEPPSGELIVTDVTFGDYASFNAAMLNHFQRSGKTLVKRAGQETARLAIAHQSGVYNLSTVIAAKLLPHSVKLKMGLSAMMAGFKTLNEQKARQEWRGTIEDRADCYAFIIETCPFCAGKQSQSCIGWLMEANLEEAARQVFGQFYDVVEIECRAKGDPAGVWLVPKEPSDETINQSAK
jgi:predicted hydrocarbon binding protein